MLRWRRQRKEQEWVCVEVLIGACGNDKVTLEVHERTTVHHVLKCAGSTVLGLRAQERPFELALYEEKNGFYRMLPYQDKLLDHLDRFTVGSRLVLRPNISYLGILHLEQNDFHSLSFDSLPDLLRSIEKDDRQDAVFVKLLFEEALQRFKRGYYRSETVVEAGQLIALSFLATCADETARSVNAQRLSGWMADHDPKAVCGRAGQPAVLSQALGSCHELLQWRLDTVDLHCLFLRSLQASCSKVYMGEFFECNQAHFSTVSRHEQVASSISEQSERRRGRKTASAVDSGFHTRASSPSSVRMHVTTRGKSTSVFSDLRASTSRADQRHAVRQTAVLSEAAADAGQNVNIFPVRWVSVNGHGLQILYQVALEDSGLSNPLGMGQDLRGIDIVREKEEVLLSFELAEMEHWSCSPDGNVFALCVGKTGQVIHLSGVVNGWAHSMVKLLSLYRLLFQLHSTVAPERGQAFKLYEIFQIPPSSHNCNESVLFEYCRVLSTSVPSKSYTSSSTREQPVYSTAQKERSEMNEQGKDHKEKSQNFEIVLAFLLRGTFRRHAKACKRKAFARWSRATRLAQSIADLINRRERAKLRRVFSDWRIAAVTQRQMDSLVTLCTRSVSEQKNHMMLARCFRGWCHVFMNRSTVRQVHVMHLSQVVDKVVSRQKALRLGFLRWKAWEDATVLIEQEQESIGEQDTARKLGAACRLFIMFNRSVLKSLRESFGKWCEKNTFGKATCFAGLVDKVVERRMRRSQERAFHTWRKFCSSQSARESLLQCLGEIVESNLVCRKFHQSWGRWKRYSATQGRRCITLGNVLGAIGRRLALSRAFSHWRQRFSCSRMFRVARLAASRWAWTRLAWWARMGRYVGFLVEKKKTITLAACFETLKVNTGKMRVVELAALVGGVERRILLQRGINSWKQFVMTRLVAESTAVSTLCRVFESYQGGLVEERKREAFQRWRSHVKASNVVYLNDLVEAVQERILIRRGLGAWRQFVLARDAEESFSLQRISEVLGRAYMRSNRERLKEAMKIWKTVTRYDTLAWFVASTTRMITIRRALERWKLFVMAKEAEETFAIHVLTSVFRQYEERDHLYLARRSFDQWKTVILADKCQGFCDIAQALMVQVRARRAMQRWRQFVLSRTLEESFAVDVILRVFGSYERNSQLRSSFDVWKCSTRACVVHDRVEAFLEIKVRQMNKKVFQSWRRFTTFQRQRKREAISKLCHVSDDFRMHHAFWVWNQHASSIRKADLLETLSSCQEALMQLRKSCKSDLDAARQYLTNVTAE